MAYEKHTWGCGEPITAEKLNNIENGIANAGYDLVIAYDFVTQSAYIVSGDILDCEDKLDNGDIVKAVCIAIADWSYTPSLSNSNKDRYFLPLIKFNAPYCFLSFGGAWGGTQNNQTPTTGYISINYSPSTGAIMNAYVGGGF